MSNKIFLVIKREYLKIVKRPAFWISVFLIPLFVLIITLVSGYSGKSVEKKIEESVKNAKAILIIDQSGLIPDSVLAGAFQRANDKEAAIKQVKDGQADAVFILPTDLASSHKVEVHAQDAGLISMSRYNSVVKNLINQSIIAEIPDLNKQALLNADLDIETTNYAEGEIKEYNFEGYILPGASVLIYFLLIMASVNMMLMSVVEEKENRMIETVLSTISPRKLIWGKIIAFTGVAFTQLISLVGLSVVVLLFTHQYIPFKIDWAAINVNPWQALVAVYFIITGFLFMASIMVGLGSAMPTYKDAQAFAPPLIILSICPVYFASILVADPTGLVSQIVSYTPFTAQLVLLFRNALGALPWYELIAGMAAMLVYVVAGFYAAFKLFEFGSLEYAKKISLKYIFKRRNQ